MPYWTTRAAGANVSESKEEGPRRASPSNPPGHSGARRPLPKVRPCPIPVLFRPLFFQGNQIKQCCCRPCVSRRSAMDKFSSPEHGPHRASPLTYTHAHTYTQHARGGQALADAHTHRGIFTSHIERGYIEPTRDACTGVPPPPKVNKKVVISQKRRRGTRRREKKRGQGGL